MYTLGVLLVLVLAVGGLVGVALVAFWAGPLTALGVALAGGAALGSVLAYGFKHWRFPATTARR